MKSKHQNIINSSALLFNEEGYVLPSVDRISEAAGISKMTFYRYFKDKESLIRAILEDKHQSFISEILAITEKEVLPKDKLFAIFSFYHTWFARHSFHGCMFSRAVVELGNNMPSLSHIVFDFKSDLLAVIRDIVKKCLKPEPAERVAFILIMLIDGAISVSQTMDKEAREYPAAMTAWSAAKAVIYSEGGEL
jgi:AcrR family transcriptional regulator